MQIGTLVIASFVTLAMAGKGERTYISYGALKKDTFACYGPNEPIKRCYYATEGPANGYTRGCSRISHCAREFTENDIAIVEDD
ncbi:hypothetical protein VD0002_g1214 [Verticillium dahliae]|uniref:Uncharacterized protein n=1 Tax=Verticillium dahliae TaxID=27337 RepID=A0AA44WLA7_VERDA|nr:hypothetical protein BJF96_g5130 [Verticillium dahliae]PNH55165.1 hypothetical protein VD0003_g2397 [Verticillium dahliae]PNH69022.1 hypothetical protein VD0002_g1214 [Verticillium dahliae]